MTAPLISVITPTWQRHELLMERCIPSVFSQTWRTVEHVVISDGPDRVVANLLAHDLWRRPRKIRPLVFDYLIEHDSSPHNWGSAARNHGAKLATGELVAYLDDDNAYRPNHLQVLADELLANPWADFAYSQMLTHPGRRVIGAIPPTYGHIDTSLLMHRADTLDRFGAWPLAGQIQHFDQHAPDWGAIAGWLDRGAQWVHVPQVTVDYFSGEDRG